MSDPLEAAARELMRLMEAHDDDGVLAAFFSLDEGTPQYPLHYAERVVRVYLSAKVEEMQTGPAVVMFESLRKRYGTRIGSGWLSDPRHQKEIAEYLAKELDANGLLLSPSLLSSGLPVVSEDGGAK